MKQQLFIILSFFFSLIVKAQDCGDRYINNIFDSVNIQTVNFDNEPDYRGIQINLYADIYTPKGDTSSDRAMIIYVHGGGFYSGHVMMLIARLYVLL